MTAMPRPTAADEGTGELAVEVGRLTWAVEQLLRVIDGDPDLTPSARRYVVARAREIVGQEAGR